MSDIEPHADGQLVEAFRGWADLPVRDTEFPAPAPGGARMAETRRVALLARALEEEVIPRLALARAALSTTPPTDGSAAQPSAEDVSAVAQRALRGDLEGALAVVEALQARGAGLEQVYLELLSPAARHLGELWTDDLCDFASVTVGLCCLQQVVLESRRYFGARHGRREAGRRILLAPVPGEQHSFGLLMVGEFFRRSGWDVSSGTGASARELVATARKQWFSMVGFTIACEQRLDALAGLIRDIRRSSRNPHLGVLVGGQLFLEQPELAVLVGADATAADGHQAVLKAETLAALLRQDV